MWRDRAPDQPLVPELTAAGRFACDGSPLLCEFSDIPAKTVPILFLSIFQLFRADQVAMRQDLDG